MDIRRLAPGDRLLDYRVLERLGEGGFGEVFRAEHELLKRIVAIKVPRDQGGLTALRHEGVVQSSLDHKSIVRTIELSLSHDPPYVVMEYIDGQSLAELIRREGGIPWRRAARILFETANALHYAHQQGVVHGDIKPGNVLVEPGRAGRVMLTDFGLGRVFEGPQGNLQISRSLELATSGAEVQGTIRYLAPELLRGESVDERADMYSFGVLLFETLTGRLPEGREVPTELVPGLPPEFDRMFTRLFTRRERRPRSLEATLTELRALVDGKPSGDPHAVPAKNQAGVFKTPGVGAAKVQAVSAECSAEASPVFRRWRETLLDKTAEGIEVQHVRELPVEGVFGRCWGATAEGEPHHRVYATVQETVDANQARALMVEARQVFEREKGIWEKEVTFAVVTRKVEDLDRVLWTFKSFSMGWWRRRRVLLYCTESKRLYANELGCDPAGNALKRGFVASLTRAAELTKPQTTAPVATRLQPYRGSAWGAGMALLMAFGVVVSVMSLELAARCNLRNGASSEPAFVSAPGSELVGEVEAYLQENPGASLDALVEALDADPEDVLLALSELEAETLVPVSVVPVDESLVDGVVTPEPAPESDGVVTPEPAPESDGVVTPEPAPESDGVVTPEPKKQPQKKAQRWF